MGSRRATRRWHEYHRGVSRAHICRCGSGSVPRSSLITRDRATLSWQSRDAANILFVRYGDLRVDTRGEIQRIADFLGIEVAEKSWPRLLRSVTIDAMGQEAQRGGDTSSLVFDGGAARFFFQGPNGRWRDVLDEGDLAIYDAAAAQLEPSLREWLEGARHAITMD